jgi:hypothetical protein
MPLVQLETVIGPDGQTLIFRDPEGSPCSDGLGHVDWLMQYKGLSKTSHKKLRAFADTVCDARGVYAFAGGKLVKRRSGVVLARPSSIAIIQGPQLAGPCVDPASHLRSQYSFDMGASFATALPSDLDLDGDGTSDVVLNAGAARWQTTYALYVRREGCGYFVGNVPASEWPRRLPQKSNGLYDLLTSDDECPGVSSQRLYSDYCDLIWRFNGTIYVHYRSALTHRQPKGIQP